MTTERKNAVQLGSHMRIEGRRKFGLQYTHQVNTIVNKIIVNLQKVMIQVVMKVYKGKSIKARRNGCFEVSTTTLVKVNSSPATIAAMAGVINHARTIATTPPGKGEDDEGGLLHTMESPPATTNDMPIIAPTME